MLRRIDLLAAIDECLGAVAFVGHDRGRAWFFCHVAPAWSMPLRARPAVGVGELYLHDQSSVVIYKEVCNVAPVGFIPLTYIDG